MSIRYNTSSRKLLTVRSSGTFSVRTVLLFVIVASLLNSILIATINIASIYNFMYAFVLALGLYYIIFKNVNIDFIALFAGYSLLIIVIYLIQIYTFPDFFGLTPGAIAGTDDSYFYSQVATNLSNGFPLRDNYLSNIHTYSLLLRFLTPLPVNHPLDVLFINAIPVSFIPKFTKDVSIYLTGQRTVGKISFVFSAICPFTLANGLILIREGWTAALLIGGIYFLVYHRFVLLLFTLLLLNFLRTGSAGLLLITLLLFSPIVYQKLNIRKEQKRYFGYVLAGFITVLCLVSLPSLLSTIQNQGLISGLMRSDFLHNLEGSTLGSIVKQPWYIRIPLSFTFFFFTPFFGPGGFVVNGEFVVRKFLAEGIFPILSLAYFFFVIRATEHAIRELNWNMILVILSYIFSILIISLFSLEIRHKVAIMPIMYLLASYGVIYKTHRGTVLGILGVLMLFLVQLVSLAL